MSSTNFVENLNAAGTARVEGTATLGSSIVFTNVTNDVAFAAQAQSGASGIAEIPDLAGASDSVIMAQLPQVIGNKSIETSSSTVDDADNTKTLQVNLSGATTGTTTTVVYSQTANRTITIPDADGTVALAPSAGTANALVKINATGDEYDETSIISAAGTDLVGVTAISNGAAADIALGDAGQVVNLAGGISVAENASITGDVSVAGSMVIAQDLTVNGTTTSVNSQNVTIEDNNLLLSSNYTTPSARSGGITINFAPINTASVASGGFTATTVTVGAFAPAGDPVAGDIILVSGAAEPSNNGIFEVSSFLGGVITIEASPTFNFLNSTFIADATNIVGTVSRISVAALQCGTDGIFEVGSGSNTGSIVFEDLATGAGNWVEQTLSAAPAQTIAAIVPTVPADSTITVEVVVSARDNAATNGHFSGKLSRSFSVNSGTVAALGAGQKDFSSNGEVDTNWNGGNLFGVAQIIPDGGATNVDIVLTASGVATTDWKILYRVLVSA